MKRILSIIYECSKKYIDLYQNSNRDFEYLIITNEQIVQQGIAFFIESTVDSINNGDLSIDGIFSSNEMGAAIASLIAERTGLRGPTFQSIVTTQNKYAARILGQECIPDQTPSFFLVGQVEHLEKICFPLFTKPVRGSLSFFSFVVNSKEELDAVRDRSRSEVYETNSWYEQLLISAKVPLQITDSYNDLLCEQLVQGRQITLDGYVVNGTVSFFGCTESFFLEGTISFTHFDFPVTFASELEDHIYDSASKIVAALELDNTLFNIEYIVDEHNKRVWLIEVNPRVSMQFTPLIEAVTGINPIEVASLIACGVKPDAGDRDGEYETCRSCCLRRRADGRAVRVPTRREIYALERKYDGVAIFPLVELGKKLSNYRQDSCTFRYCLISIPGKSSHDITKKLKLIQQELPFDFD